LICNIFTVISPVTFAVKNTQNCGTYDSAIFLFFF